VDDLIDPLVAPVRAFASAAGSLTRPIRSGRRVVALARAASAMVADGIVAPASSLNGPVGPARRLSWVRADLESVKASGHARGGTANDVLLAAVAHGLRTLLLARGERPLPGAAIKAAVPVSLRDGHGDGALGNQVGAVLVRLPVGIADPVARLDAVIGAESRAKGSGEAELSKVLLSAADLLPEALVGSIARLSDRQPLTNVVVTNVPGPQIPLYFRGAKMLEAYPVVPLGGNLTVGVAALSYDGTLAVGLNADADAVPDLDVLRDGIAAGFEAMRPT
jgi:WS/DGAT/MGAT family acyltransferase